MRANTKFIISFLLFFISFTINGQNLLAPKIIKAKGEYIQRQTKMVFPEKFLSYQRKDIYSFDMKKKNIGVVYENEQKQTTISFYIYPAGDGYEGRLRKEYQITMQSIANFSDKGTLAAQFAVRHEGEKYICNGFKAIITEEQRKINTLTLFECGQWFFKVRITTNELDSTQMASLEEKIYSQYDPSKLTALNPLNPKTNVYFNKSAFKDSVLLGSAMGSAFKKISWALENVKENERASGFPDLYLNLQVESLKEFMEFQHRIKSQKSDYTKQYLDELQLISDAGFLTEFVMEQFGMVLIIPENTSAKYDDYKVWKLSNNITIVLNQAFYLVSYEQMK